MPRFVLFCRMTICCTAIAHLNQRETMHAAAYNYHQPMSARSPEYGAPAPTHPILVGYLMWGLGFTGLHRFYFGKPLTGILWFFTGGLFLIGWIVDLFLIPAMAHSANRRYINGRVDHTVTWLLHLFLGIFGVHRFYMGKILTGILWLCTGGLLGIGFIYDTLTLNEQVEEVNRQSW